MKLDLFSMLSLCLTLSLTSLTACEARKMTDPDAPSVDKVEVSAADLAGTPADFTGTWSGPCHYLSGTGAADPCTLQLVVVQSATQFSYETILIADGATFDSTKMNYNISPTNPNSIMTTNVPPAQVGNVGVNAFKIVTSVVQLTVGMTSAHVARVGLIFKDQAGGVHAVSGQLHRP